MKRPLILAAISVVAAVACRTWRPIQTSDEYRSAEAACGEDDQVACGYLAESLRVSGRYERSWKLAQQSCDAGTAIGCAVVGWFFKEGHGDVSTDNRRALGYLEHACDRGIPGACVDVGVLLLEGDGIPQNLERAVWASDRACDGGHLMGCSNLGLLLGELWNGHLDPPAARALFLSTCDAGSVAACRRAGLSLFQGTGGSRDQDAGRALLEATCARRDARACMELGHQDSRRWATYPQARRAYRLACAADSSYGCVGLVETLMAVDAGPDQWEALDAAERSCASGNQAGCSLLSGLLLRENLAIDRPRALALSEQTCDAGQRYGCAVRSRFEDGGGASWLRRAVELGHVQSIPDYLSVLEPSLRRVEAGRLCDAGSSAACALPDGGQW